MIYKAIVFLPAIGALIAGLLGRIIGPRPCEIVTTAFVGIAAVLSWISLWQVGFGGQAGERQGLRHRFDWQGGERPG